MALNIFGRTFGAFVDREVLFAWKLSVSGNVKTEPALSTTTMVHSLGGVGYMHVTFMLIILI